MRRVLVQCELCGLEDYTFNGVTLRRFVVTLLLICEAKSGNY